MSSIPLPWQPFFMLALLGLGAIALVTPGLLPYVLPAAVGAIALLLYLYRPVGYVAFTWWVCLLAPGVRRLVDYQVGWDPYNPIGLAPMLAAGVSALSLLRPGRVGTSVLPMTLAAIALGYGYLSGIVQAGPVPATYELLTWLAPVLFGLHLLIDRERYAAYRQAFLTTFGRGAFVLGAYGIWQFFSPADWDIYWMQHCGMGSIGSPEPMMVRVFSLHNAPAPFGLWMMAALLLLVAAITPGRLLAAGVGAVALALSLVRSAWGGLAFGLLLLLIRLPGRARLQLALGIAVTALLVGPFLATSSLSEVVATRAQSLGSLAQDTSYRERSQFHADQLLSAATRPWGTGLGSVGMAKKLNGKEDETTFDSGIMYLVVTLGWPGALLYLAGMGLALARGARHRSRLDTFPVASHAIALALFANLASLNTLVNGNGLLFWAFAAMAVAAPVPEEETEAEEAPIASASARLSAAA